MRLDSQHKRAPALGVYGLIKLYFGFYLYISESVKIFGKQYACVGVSCGRGVKRQKTVRANGNLSAVLLLNDPQPVGRAGRKIIAVQNIFALSGGADAQAYSFLFPVGFGCKNVNSGGWGYFAVFDLNIRG